MQGPEPEPRHETGGVKGQLTTTASYAYRLIYPIRDIALDICIWVLIVAHFIEVDLKKMKRALCREVDRRNQGRLDPENREQRNEIQELYFGICVLMLAIFCGQLVGGSISFNLAKLFGLSTAIIEMILLITLPLYAYLHLRRIEDANSIDYRTWLYSLTFAISALLSNLMGKRLLNTLPAFFIIPPMLLATFIDTSMPYDLYSARSGLLCAISVVGLIATYVASRLLGLSAYSWKIINLLHYIVLIGHYEIVAGNIHKKSFKVVESQLLYVVVLLLLQMMVAMAIGWAPK